MTFFASERRVEEEVMTKVLKQEKCEPAACDEV